MLHVLPLTDAAALLFTRFTRTLNAERAALNAACGRVLAADVCAREYVPGFDRSSVDGYAVRAKDTFGCSQAIPALLQKTGEVRMGESPAFRLEAGCCAAVPTGGALPAGADAMVMIENTEDFGDGTIAVYQPSAPGAHVIYRGDDVVPGRVLLRAGTRLLPKDVGALAALGVTEAEVYRKPRVAVLSTGNELVTPSAVPAMGQVRDVNGPALCALCAQAGAEAVHASIVPDDEALLTQAVRENAAQADMVLLSGSSSVGEKDAAAKALSALGEVLFHGVAAKPGKPTLAADVGGVPVFGLPGHPVAAHFMFLALVRPLLYAIQGQPDAPETTVTATLTRAVPSNHGREEFVPVALQGGEAVPFANKSGLITTLCAAQGYIRVPRQSEGFDAGAQVTVTLF